MIHDNQPLLYVSCFETSATALCGTTGIIYRLIYCEYQLTICYHILQPNVLRQTLNIVESSSSQHLAQDVKAPQTHVALQVPTFTKGLEG